MASALAHPLFRTSSLDQGLHTPGSSVAEGDIAQYHGPSPDPRLPSPLPLPPGPVFLKDVSRSSSASTQSSTSMLFPQPQFHTQTASHSVGRTEEYNGPSLHQHPHQQQHHHHHHHQQSRSSLPGLTTLASLATTRDAQLRYFTNCARVHHD